MILRSVMRHVRDQNWFAVGIDFLIVVVGVFIGIQVANWNEARSDRAKERTLLLQLRDELDEAATQDRYVLEGYAQVFRAGERAMALLDEGRDCTPDCRSVVVDFFHASQWQGINLNLPTYDELRRNGWPRDREIMEAVEAYRRQSTQIGTPLAEPPEYRSRVRGLIPLALHGPYWVNCVVILEGFESYLNDCESAIDAALAERAVENIRSDPEIHRLMTEWVGYAGGYTVTIADQVNLARTAIRVIDEKLEGPE